MILDELVDAVKDRYKDKKENIEYIKEMANKFLLIEKKDFGNKVADYLKRRCNI